MKKTLFTLIAVLFFGSISFSQVRSYDQRGINKFESSKEDLVKFDKLKLKIGGSFTQSFQTLKHSSTTTATPGIVAIVPGFNTANANLYFDAFLADGVTLNMTLYLSSRHHNEAWVKGGYIQFDKLPFLKSGLMDKVMEFTTIKVGHMEVNYGDAHYRRSDNGNSIYNPFVENYIMDAFATEIGAEIDFQYKGFLAVAGFTNGKIKGDIAKGVVYAGGSDGKSKPVILGKIGFDKQLNKLIRLRVTGSGYYTAGSISNTLYGGDRTGSHYFGVMDNALTTSTAFSGRFNPGFTDKIGAVMGNLFVKVGGLEWFTTVEAAKGRAKAEQIDRNASQFATDLVYRFGKSENFWIGGRYNKVSSVLAGGDVSINRVAVTGGWFVTKNIMAKAEYVSQNYNGFVATDLRNGGKFNGFVIEAVVGF
ncbi:MAG TPA: hypothetical protein DEG92_06910 [Rikenellaceae bacterium]|nr:hypothetical protein [Rikenellaceae bacterium]